MSPRIATTFGEIIGYDLLNFKAYTPFDPAIPPLGVCQLEIKHEHVNMGVQDSLTHSSEQQKAKRWKQPKGPSGRKGQNKSVHILTTDCS